MKTFLQRNVRELFRIRYRLLLVNVLIVSVPLIGVGFARLLERAMLKSLEDDMINQARVVREMVRAASDSADPAPLSSFEPILRRAARDTRTRIRLLDARGEVRADSHRDGAPEGPEQPTPVVPGIATPSNRYVPPEKPGPLQLSTRPEVQKALTGNYGAATRVWRWQADARHSSGGERVFLFSALPIARAPDDAVDSVGAVVYVTRSTTPVLTAMYKLRASLLQTLLIAVGATMILSLFLAGTISRPITLLMRRARALAAGDTRVGLHLERRDEIGDLARTIEVMAAQLAARADEAAALAANISHEFKSPLTALRGAAELLLDGAADNPADRKKFLTNMLEDTRRLDRLVTRLLELSRLEAARAAVESIDCHDLIRAAVNDESRAHGTDIQIHTRARSGTVWGRRAALESALANLVQNAAQHARAGTAVVVGTEDMPDGHIRIAIHNQGDPIDESVAVRVWERFFTTRAENGGTGLGLPIVAAVAKSHGGSVGFESTRDRGTTFFMHLPRGQPGVGA